MYRIAACIALEHNLVLVAVAIAVCGVGTFVSARLLQRTLASAGWTKQAWTMLGAIVAGSTIWCTHFVAMLAYEPGVPVTYDTFLTLLSLCLAVLGCAAAFGLANARLPHAPILGGIVFGFAVTAMHYCGMSAFGVPGTIEWDPRYVLASVACAILLGGVGYKLIALAKGLTLVLVGAAVLSLSIASLHFTGMAAMTIEPLSADWVSGADEQRLLIAFAVAGIGLLILAIGMVTYLLDQEVRTSSDTVMRHLTQSAVDGMVVVRSGTIVTANAEFARMAGLERSALAGRNILQMLEDETPPECGRLVTTKLKVADGSLLPIELSVGSEPLDGRSAPVTVYALRDISQRLEQSETISFFAQFDSLTGLRNRSSFLERAGDLLAEASEGRPYAVFALDIDRFKEKNDLYGHEAGDEVLRTIGRRFGDLLCRSQIAARLGGDEFALISPVSEAAPPCAMATRLRRDLFGRIDFEGTSLTVSASIGFAVAPRDGIDIQTLTHNADLALQRAKTSHRSDWCAYDKSMDAAVTRRNKLIEDLRGALARGELELHYQKQVDVTLDTVTGFEALVRWHHPERGMVSPGEFIPLAEQTGLIVRIEAWVLRTACEEAVGWPKAWRVSVNLSPIQLNDPKLIELIKDVLRTTRLEPGRLELEVTETSFVLDRERAIHVIDEIRALGIAVSIDDFGTGYSSLSMLQSISFDKIKIDKSFIDQIDQGVKATSVLRAVLSLGTALGVPVVAEGVETIEQLTHLRKEGCRIVQGYYYGEPQRTIDASVRTSAPLQPTRTAA